MEDYDYERRISELERRVRRAEKKLDETVEKERRLHNLVLRLSATNMALGETLQGRKMIDPAAFQKKVESNIRLLDREISEKKMTRLLDDIWKDREDESD